MARQLLYLSPVPLDSFAQRPHHFVRWFHGRYGGRVLWLDPYPARLPCWNDLSRIQRRPSGTGLGPMWSREPWLDRIGVPALPFEPLAAGRWLNRRLWRALTARLERFIDADTCLVFGKPCALAIELAERYAGNVRVFDVMDNMPAFSSGCSRQWLLRAETLLADKSDLVVTSSSALQDRFEEHRHKLLCIRNGLTIPGAARPTAQAARMVFGYIGSIAPWFDWSAVERLARLYPHAVVRLIGPVESKPGQLPPNVELRSAIPQHEVYQALHEFTLGLIPFKVSDLTESVDPVKYYEYRAAGLPVLTTRFGEMRCRGPRDQVFFLDELQPETDWRQLRLQASDSATVENFIARHRWERVFEPLGLALREPG